jgi:hypothetical protein
LAKEYTVRPSASTRITPSSGLSVVETVVPEPSWLEGEELDDEEVESDDPPQPVAIRATAVSESAVRRRLEDMQTPLVVAARACGTRSLMLGPPRARDALSQASTRQDRSYAAVLKLGVHSRHELSGALPDPGGLD